MLAVTACDKKEDAAAEEPAAEETAEETATEGEETAEAAEKNADKGAAKPVKEADKEGATLAKIGEPAPDFELTDEAGETHKLSDYKGKTVVLEWTNPECPVVQRHYEAKTMQDSIEKVDDDVVWLAVDSSNFVKPEDSKKWKSEHKVDWPQLQDPSGKVGKQYGAKTTPHMYVVDAEGVLRYAGAIDDDPHGKKDPAERTNFVVEAVTALSAGKDVPKPQTKPYGCSVKYDS